MNSIDVRRGATSASSAYYDLLCPGRHLMQKNVPAPDAEEETPEQAFGRRVHEALRLSDPTGLSAQGQKIYEQLKEMEVKALTQYFGPQAPEAAKNVSREQRYWCMVHNRYEHSGAPDVVYWHGNRGLVLEYKTLVGAADAVVNQQLRDYAVLVAGYYKLVEVGVALLQPLQSTEVELVIYTSDDLRRATREMFDRVTLSNDPNAPRKPGVEQCKYCRARSICEEYRRWAAEGIPVDESTPVATLITEPMVKLPVKDWPPAVKKQFCDSIERVQAAFKWWENCKAEIVEALRNDPNAVPGWTLKKGAVRVQITDPVKLWEKFSADGGKPEQFMPCVTIQKAKFTDAVAELTGLRGRQLEARVKVYLEGCSEEKETAPILVPIEKAKGKKTIDNTV